MPVCVVHVYGCINSYIRHIHSYTRPNCRSNIVTTVHILHDLWYLAMGSVFPLTFPADTVVGNGYGWGGARRFWRRRIKLHGSQVMQLLMVIT